MKRSTVALKPAAERDLEEIADYIADRSGETIALTFVTRIRQTIMSLANAPFRGTLHEELGDGCRTFGFERRATIAFRVEEHTQRVVILGVFYGGRKVAARN